ncbi:MAG: hypothetical protein JXR64_11180 [Spirochaetales bacterium]|nr:hypothetical protein [Spirochaetales bacterium]
MSIKPLDLQTLFIKMAQVGKDQAAIQKSVENQQNREANVLIKEENNRDHSVNKAEEDKDIEKTNDKNGSGQRNSKEQEKKKDKTLPEDDKINFFTDPERGHNVDISG